mmetsp:Transcript_8510/g.24410  ORF Transcript_8510/g.24410 Transcript_8510/m.24410 type:complete len:260 (+) Transcript_8510:227-1006(+)|eukprot:CAMPEP_0117672952 /NCGR_PEP_ID=MMETSP0804-20121206/14202_1 /TAXON_ID=1074897 /ORGANISM="Tetraselmis astigmatica, Strain CCMP880" /LENGTH=259 /DNA_ID=CAMNT_0005481635 /DNA_START=218 /DNA_END=997 /DNA_ORIENTATION=-
MASCIATSSTISGGIACASCVRKTARPSVASSAFLHKAVRAAGSPYTLSAGGSRFLGKAAPSRNHRAGLVRYKESQIEGEINDWRIKQMCQVAHRYYTELWSKGAGAWADDILDEDVELKDELWATHPFVGRTALKKQVQHFRHLYPDLVMEIDDIGVSGTQDLSIRWSARATNLGGPHATHHYTHFSGVSSIHFTDDRKKVKSVVTYRQPTAEEMSNRCEISWRSSPSTTEIQLVPLHVSTANYDYLPGLNKKNGGEK